MDKAELIEPIIPGRVWKESLDQGGLIRQQELLYSLERGIFEVTLLVDIILGRISLGHALEGIKAIALLALLSSLGCNDLERSTFVHPDLSKGSTEGSLGSTEGEDRVDPGGVNESMGTNGIVDIVKVRMFPRLNHKYYPIRTVIISKGWE